MLFTKIVCFSFSENDILSAVERISFSENENKELVCRTGQPVNELQIKVSLDSDISPAPHFCHFAPLRYSSVSKQAKSNCKTSFHNGSKFKIAFIDIGLTKQVYSFFNNEPVFKHGNQSYTQIHFLSMSSNLKARLFILEKMLL